MDLKSIIDENGHAVLPNGITRIEQYTFSSCRHLSSIELPNSITEIGFCAFRDCSELTKIVIPDSVVKIEAGAFSGCTKLKNIEIPDSVVKIEAGAFFGCTKLKNIEIPASVQEIGSGAFACSISNIIVAPDNNHYKSINNFCLTKDGTQIVFGHSIQFIPVGVTIIGAGAFAGQQELKSVSIPNSITKIGDAAFAYCTELESITIPPSVKEIGCDAFRECEKITSISFPDGLSKIEERTCAFCENLTSVEIPDSVKEIGAAAFSKCQQLECVRMSNNVTKIGSNAFNNCYRLSSIEIPGSVVEIGEHAFGYTGLKDIYIHSKNPSEASYLFNCFDGWTEPSRLTLHVPIGTGYSYRHTEGFMNAFKEIIADSNTKLTSETQTKYFIFFDTETTGIPGNYGAPTSDVNNWPRVIQFSWIVQDINGVVISTENHIIQPDGFKIPSESSAIHGITTEVAKKEGEVLKVVMDKFFKDLNEAKIVVGHNIEFDIKVAGCESFRVYGHDIFEGKTVVDTMKESIDFCALPPFMYGEYKWPKLQELHKALFGITFNNAHNSAVDVEITAKCFWELVRLGIIKNIK